MRSARVFDRPASGGEPPSVSRPAVPEAEVERIVAYLRNAPTVLSARSYAPDEVDPSRGDQVPLAFKTDGSWVWAGAVYYYLDKHGVPPEPDLVEHIRAQGYRVPEVDDARQDIAIEIATGQREPDPPPARHAPQGPPPGAAYGQPGPYPGPPPPPGAHPGSPPPPGAPPPPGSPLPPGAPPYAAVPGYGPGPAGPPHMAPPMAGPMAGPYPGPPMPAPYPGQPGPPPVPGPGYGQGYGPVPGPPQPYPPQPGHAGPPPLPNAFPPGPGPAPGGYPPGQPPYPGQPGPVTDDPLATLERRLRELGVDPALYRFNQAAEGAWSLVPEAGRWSVFFLQNGQRRKQVLHDTQDRAAAYLLGALLFYPRPLP
ncbi:hypothetical protein ACFY4C_16655 [Actinomadura viridis]|uniref:hypothetical protein n=1 Tax=Actinomadura viridis TaxID=58110 RepID=UPI0036B68DCE